MGNKIWGRYDSTNLPKIVEEAIPIIQKMGVRVLEMNPGRVSLRMPLAGNDNHIGMMYAGALFILGEMPGGALFLTSFDATKYAPIIKKMDIIYKRPATTDVTVTATMTPEEIERIQEEVVNKGKADYVLECVLKDTSDEIIALTRAEYRILKFVS